MQPMTTPYLYSERITSELWEFLSPETREPYGGGERDQRRG
jgi:hypothetical protein